MSDTILERFDLKKFFSGFVNPTTWSKTIVYLIIGGVIVFLLICVKNFFFPSKTIVNKPYALVLGKAEKDSINQSSINVSVEKEREWEVGFGVGAGRFDGKDGYGGGVFVKKRF